MTNRFPSLSHPSGSSEPRGSAPTRSAVAAAVHPAIASLEQKLQSRFSNLFVADDGAVAIHVGDRVFPRIGHERATLSIPENLRKLLPSLVDQLPFSRSPKSGDGARETMFKMFSDSTVMLGSMFSQIGELMRATLDANIEVRTDWLTDRRKSTLMQQKSRELADFLPKLAFRGPKVANVELYNKPEYVIHGVMGLALRECCENLILTFADMLDLLVDMEMVGIIDWQGNKSCRFHFFKHVVLERTDDVRLLTHTSQPIVTATPISRITESTQTIRRETDVHQTHRRARHVHEVINAENIGLPVSKLPMPQRVTDLMANIPEWIKPAIRIVTGTEIRRLVIEQDLRTEQLTEVEEQTTVQYHEEFVYRPDPAVVIGSYVLTGWGEEEL